MIRPRAITVWKFGGSTLRDAHSIRRVAALIAPQARREPTVAVCSALTGVTDHLARAVERIRRRQFRVAQRELAEICARHLAVLADLRPPANHAALADIQKIIVGLQNAVHSAAEARAGAAWAAQVLACGESLSARLLAIALDRAGMLSRAVDASDVIVTTRDFECAAPLWDETRARARRELGPLLDSGVTPLVTGFFGAALDGRITLLGRNSSDYSAAIIAHALDAASVCLWKDVDGFFDTDPKQNGNAEFLRELSYDDAQALLDSGARVLNSRALAPLREKCIPLFIRNASRPHSAGTRIGAGQALLPLPLPFREIVAQTFPSAPAEDEWEAAR